MAKFSIVLPTKDRSHLLEKSVIPTIARQTYNDFEIVICDNASRDDTPNVADKLIEKYGNIIKYKRTDTWIPKEKFFQWSMDKAEGKYLTLFFDDDVLTSNALTKIHDIDEYDPKNEVITYSRSMCYFYEDYPDLNRKNLLIIPPFSGKVWKYNSLNHLKKVFERNEIFRPSPMVSNAFYSVDLYQRVKSKYNDLYPHGHMGDYNICCFMLSETDNFYYLDDPIAVFGQWSKNTSAQLHDLKTTMDEYTSWIKDFSDKYLTSMPWKHYLWPNCVCAALNQTSETLKIGLKVNKLNYFRSINEEIEKFENNKEMAATLLVMKKDLVKVASEYLGSENINQIYDRNDLLPAHGHIDGEESIEKLKKSTYIKFPNDIWHEIKGNDNDKFKTIRSSVDYFESITGETNQVFLSKYNLDSISPIKTSKLKKIAKRILPENTYRSLSMTKRRIFGINFNTLEINNYESILEDCLLDIKSSSFLDESSDFCPNVLFQNNANSWHSALECEYPLLIKIQFKYSLIFSKIILIPQLKSTSGESFIPRFPKKFTINISKNGINWITLKDVNLNLRNFKKQENQEVEIDLDRSINTKYLSLKIEENFGDPTLCAFNRIKFK